MKDFDISIEVSLIFSTFNSFDNPAGFHVRSLYIKFLFFFSLLAMVLAGCDYFISPEAEEECVFQVRISNNDGEDNGKAHYAMFFLMHKAMAKASYFRPDGHSDYVQFSVNKSCRTVLETILEKM